MDRRQFLTSATVTTATVSMGLQSAGAQDKTSNAAKFKLRYAPTLNCFKHHVGNDPSENVKFAADNGFRGMFDNGFGRRPYDQQKAILAEMEKHDMKLGPFGFSGMPGGKAFVGNDKDTRKQIVEACRKTVEVAKRVNAKWILLVPGSYDDRLEWDYQTANVIDNLRACVEILESAGCVMVLEPLNAWTNHPGRFLTKIPQAYLICRAVNSPSVKIINDLYHQQIMEGNLIPNIDLAWSEIASFHIGDNPGRKEPGTGEINYKNVFKHIHSKGYEGVLCCEHGKSIGGKKGEIAFIEAYRKCDGF